MRYYIVDDDKASRTMLKNIIEEEDLGIAIGEADNGKECLSAIMTMHPDVVLIDLLMPEMDGIETIDLLKREGYEGQFVMISQIVNKEMVGEAYKKGVEFFIHKPINRIEVQSILKKIVEQCRLKESLLTIQESLANIGLANNTLQKPQSVKQIVLSTLNYMGIIGEAGSDDIISIIEYLVNERGHSPQLPPLKELYEKLAGRSGASLTEVKKETKAIEQRIRRTILTAINNLASLGAIDYTNPEFEYYAPRYFDFQEIRTHMIHIQEGRGDTAKVKVNIKKFLQVLYLETLEKYNKTH
ncbi:response regulator [Niallia taxi]|uniref:Response regulator n=1 Tax=Niallia taxi TaxID=2499688 RepID=A0A3S2TWV6_9BACI|nr:response regulator [Niallia taxi]MCM3217278.1 response regulator [Niallia taxi]MCT2345955.1 response regulator [Niallia taxi]MDE5053628.1 response regulator [Niallia taxi]MDK8643572.1 response regulator [Niallia taxi]MED3964341.1 response regulator [Niallia taxi]